MQSDRSNQPENNDKNRIGKPDPETLHTTDPQENMEGPVSSLMHETGHGFDTSETKPEADRKQQENK